MSSPLERQPGENPLSTSETCADQTDWQKIEAIDDEDINFTADSPDTSKMDWSKALFRVGGRPGTREELENFRQRCLAYANRPRRPKS